jgi:hypothetical protein
MSLTLKGLQEAQDENLRRIAALKPTGVVGRAVREATTQLHRYAVAITHVWRYKGGGLRASHRMEINDRGATGRIYVDPTAINPRGQRVTDYAIHEHNRGGSHAFYERAVRERGEQIADAAVRFITRDIEG